MREDEIKVKKTGSGLMARAEAINEASKEKPPVIEPEKKSEAEPVSVPKRKNHRHREKGRLVNRILTKVMVILILLCSLVAGGLFYLNFFSKPVVAEGKSVVIQDQLLYCQELVSIKYKYSDIVSIKKAAKIGPSKSYSIVKYTGIVRAGISDITLSDYEISEDGKSIKIILPEAEILGNDIVNQEVFDEQHSIFVPITLDEVFNELEKSREDALEEIIQDGIITDAKEHAKNIVRQIFISAGFDEVVVM